MAEERESRLKFRSLGIVVKAKELGSSTISVDPVEDFTLDSGEIKADSKKMTTELPSANGVPKKTSVTGGSVIEAKWFPFGDGNRATPDDVNANETVMLWQFADDQTYYWTKCMFEPSLRRLERVRYMYSNLKDGVKPFDENTSYWLEVSTVDQRVKLHTSDNNGEAAAYDITLNTKEGILTVQDNVGNTIELNSPDGTLSADVVEAVEIKTRVFRVISETFEIKTNTMSITSSTPAQVNCSMDMTGEMNLTGNLGVDGSVNATGTIVDAGGNTPHHSH